MTEVSIPKKVLQTWKCETLPDHWSTSPEMIAEHMPDWEYTLMTDEMNRAFVAEHFPDFLDTYDNFPYPIQRADAIRACWLYVHGGTYMDLDLHMRKPIQPLLTGNADLFLVRSQNFSSYYTNAFMATTAKHPFWLLYIEEMKKPVKWWAITKHLAVMESTGPLALTRAIKRAQAEGMSLTIAEMPPDLLSGCSVCDPKPCKLTDSYIATLEGSSWCGNDTQVFTWFYCRIWRVIIIVLVILFVIWFMRRASKHRRSR